MSLRIACATYAVARRASFVAFAEHLRAQLGEVKQQGADLALLPEYFTMELATLFPDEIRSDLARQIDALQDLVAPFQNLLRELATGLDLTVVGGSFPVRDADGRVRNRCFIALPDGQLLSQDKHRMTRFEAETWGIHGGSGHTVFACRGLSCAVAICYDSEFPLLVRDKVLRGADLILVPSCTDSRAGVSRIRIGAQARALENQCYVAVAHTVGDLPESPAIDENHGIAAVYAPADRGFPDDGVLSRSAPNQPGWTYADLDIARIHHVRQNGAVLNGRDW